MRIGMISTTRSDPWGGSEVLWADAARVALEHGHDVILSIYRWPQPATRVPALRSQGAKVLDRPLPHRYSLIQRALRRVGRFSPFRELFHSSPDVICISQGGAYDCALDDDMMAQLYASGIPYVVICHSNNDAYIPDASMRAAAVEAFTRASRVVFVSQRTLGTTERQLARRLSNATVLRNPVNLRSLNALPWPPGHTIRMAEVASLRATWKAQDILFEALAAPAWQGRDWILSLYGRGPDEAYLRELAAFYGLTERVHFAGYVDDVQRMWAENHLLVLPSRVESAPLALVEAMLCGRPAVVTDVGGMTEWVQEADTGYVAEAPTAQSVGAALERAWQNRARWPELGRRAHRVAIGRYDPVPGASLLQLLLEAARPSGIAVPRYIAGGANSTE